MDPLQINQLGEFGFIDTIRQLFPQSGTIIRGIGEDAAILPPSSRPLLISIDTLNEGVHFLRDQVDPFWLGRKSLAVNLSDIASMGGEPLYYFLALSIPPDLPPDYLTGYLEGLLDISRQYETFLVGGDTCKSLQYFNITITIVGQPGPAGSILCRNGARPGDRIFVSGPLGDSALGLKVLLSGLDKAPYQWALDKHHNPVPRIGLGRILAQSQVVTSAIDLSDGLGSDLPHILSESRVGARVNVDKIPVSGELLACRSRQEAICMAITGGEDYELLYTVSASAVSQLTSLLASHSAAGVEIGEITETLGVVWSDSQGNPFSLSEGGFRHF